MLIAWGAQDGAAAAAPEGGSWHVKVSLAPHRLVAARARPRAPRACKAPRAEFDALLESFPSAWGELRAAPHAAQFSRNAAAWTRPRCARHRSARLARTLNVTRILGSFPPLQ
jgi:hypothetical protein